MSDKDLHKSAPNWHQSMIKRKALIQTLSEQGVHLKNPDNLKIIILEKLVKGLSK